MSPRFVALSLILLLVGVAPAQASSGIQLIGGCDTPGEAFSIAVNGDYAYVADGYSGLRVISLADPAQPAEVGHYDTPGWAHGVAVNGSYAYVADYDSGLRVISVADPANPTEVGHYDTPGWACGVAVNGDRVYVADDTAGLRIISVSDPAHPTEVGHYDTQDRAWGVAVRGDTAHVASVDLGFGIISAIDPANPVVVGGFYQLNSRTLGGVAVSDNCAYVTHDLFGLLVISITPCELLGHCGAYRRASGVAASYGYAYVAADEDGLLAISVADPTHPVQVGSYDVPNWWANGVTVSGDRVYVAFGSAGLQIFQALGGVEEGPKPQAASYKPAASVVRHLPAGAVAFDALGRRALSPKTGVYFVRHDQAQAQTVTKVMVAR